MICVLAATHLLCNAFETHTEHDNTIIFNARFRRTSANIVDIDNGSSLPVSNILLSAQTPNNMQGILTCPTNLQHSLV